MKISQLSSIIFIFLLKILDFQLKLTYYFYYIIKIYQLSSKFYYFCLYFGPMVESPITLPFDRKFAYAAAKNFAHADFRPDCSYFLS